MSAPKVIPSAEAGYNGCSVNGRCFYEGSHKESECRVEVMCFRDREVRGTIRSSAGGSLEIPGGDRASSPGIGIQCLDTFGPEARGEAVA
jgi:hypothetical protein